MMLDQILSYLQRLPGLYNYGTAMLFLLVFSGLIGVLAQNYQLGVMIMIGGVCILLLLGMIDWTIEWIRSRRASNLEEGMAAQVEGRAGGGRAADAGGAVRELRGRWKKALGELRGAGLSIHSLPWYLLIGEPGGGKTTTLRQSGLDFPVGTEALSGTAGTRNCDWWFTNQAVILDTAGRWTFNEANAPDRREWDEFLALLKRNRPTCPINGVLVGIPCDALLSDSLEKRREKAQNLRDKLTHLQRYLEVQFPVYIVILKSDRILGFTQFSARVPPGEDRQLFGWSNPDPLEKPFDARLFRAHFDTVYRRAHQWRLRFAGDMSQEGGDTFDGRRRIATVTDPVDTLFAFPEEFRAAGESLAEYVETIFADNRFREPLFFRGFYFTSGLQEGQPILKACKELLRTSANAEEIVDDLAKIFRRSRSLYIQDLYAKKVFPEMGLVARSHAAVARERLIMKTFRWGGGGLAAASMIAMTWLAWNLHDRLGGIRRDLAAAKRHADPKIPDDDRVADRPAPEIAASLLDGLGNIQSGGLASLVFPLTDMESVRAPVQRAHQVFFEGQVLFPLLRGDPRDKQDRYGVEPNLGRGKLAAADATHPAFADALVHYGRWWRAAREPASLDYYRSEPGRAALEPLVRYWALTRELDEAARDKLWQQVQPGYKTLLAFDERPNTPRDRLAGVVAANYQKGLEAQYAYWLQRIAKLLVRVPKIDASQDDFLKAREALDRAYDELLRLPGTRPVPLAEIPDYATFEKLWADRYKAFSDAYAAYKTARKNYVQKLRGSTADRDKAITEVASEFQQVAGGMKREYDALAAALSSPSSAEFSELAALAAKDFRNLDGRLAGLRTEINAKRLRDTGFEITDEVLTKLAKEGMPNEALELVGQIKGQKFASAEELERPLRQRLSKYEYIDWSSYIYKFSRVVPKDGRADLDIEQDRYETTDFTAIVAALDVANGWMGLGFPEDHFKLEVHVQDFVSLAGQVGWGAMERELLMAFREVLAPVCVPASLGGVDLPNRDSGASGAAGSGSSPSGVSSSGSSGSVAPRPPGGGFNFQRRPGAGLQVREPAGAKSGLAGPPTTDQTELLRSELEPFEGRRLMALLGALRTAKLQELLTIGIERYEARFFGENPDRLPPLEYVVRAALTRAKRVPVRLDLAAPDSEKGVVTVEARGTRAFQTEMAAYAASVEAFAEASVDPTRRPYGATVLSPQLTTAKLQRRFRDALAEYHKSYLEIWRAMYQRVSVNLTEKVRTYRTWPELYAVITDEFGHRSASPPRSLLTVFDNYIKALGENLDYEKDEWLSPDDRSEFRLYGLKDWPTHKAEIERAWQQGFLAVLRTEGLVDKTDPADTMLRLAAKPNEASRLVSIEALSNTPGLPACKPFMALLSVVQHAREVLTRQTGERFVADWDAARLRDEKVIVKFPFSNNPEDASLQEAAELLSERTGVGKVVATYRPLMVRERTDVFPKILQVKSLKPDAAYFIEVWEQWRTFLLNEQGQLNRQLNVDVTVKETDRPGKRRLQEKVLLLVLRLAGRNLLSIDSNSFNNKTRAPLPVFADEKAVLSVDVSESNLGVGTRELRPVNRPNESRPSHWVLLRYVLRAENGGDRLRISPREWRVYHVDSFKDADGRRSITAEIRLDVIFPFELPDYLPKIGATGPEIKPESKPDTKTPANPDTKTPTKPDTKPDK